MLLSDYVIHASMPPAASKSELYVSKKNITKKALMELLSQTWLKNTHTHTLPPSPHALHYILIKYCTA